LLRIWYWEKPNNYSVGSYNWLERVHSFVCVSIFLAPFFFSFWEFICFFPILGEFGLFLVWSMHQGCENSYIECIKAFINGNPFSLFFTSYKTLISLFIFLLYSSSRKTTQYIPKNSFNFLFVEKKNILKGKKIAR